MKDLENPMNREPQVSKDYTESANINDDALRFEDVDADKSPEKTWDGPLGQMAREQSTPHGYGQIEAEPRPEIEPNPNTEPEIQPAPERPDTGSPNPFGNPETEPQVQPPTIIQNPVAEYNSQVDEQENKSSEEIKEESIEHSEKENLNDMKGYNEPKAKESEYYK